MPIKGLNVLFLQGSNFSWDYKYMMVSIASSQDINVHALVIKAPAQGDRGANEDLEFAPGRYNAYILSDLPANFLTAKQQKLLAESVRQGAGLMMLGGHASFGAGGWADTPLADILPVHIHPGDGRYEPDGGIKFVPTKLGLESYLLQVGTNRTETARIWDMMKPILGHEPLQRGEAERRHPGRDPRPRLRAALSQHGRRQGPVDRLRRRHLGVVPGLGGEPAGASQALATDRLLALAQGEPGRQQVKGASRGQPWF